MELFPKGHNPVKIILYKNIPFDNTYEHHYFRDFDYVDKNGEEHMSLPMLAFLQLQETSNDFTLHFESIQLTGDYNFDYGNGLICSIVLEVPTEFTSANYMRVQTTVGAIENRYYFIKETMLTCSSSNSSTVKLTLELDVIATYGKEMWENLKNKPIFTERKHCTRYIESGGRYQINGNELLINEPDLVGAKPSIVEKVVRPKLSCYSYNNIPAHTIENLHQITWLYVSLSKLTGRSDIMDRTTQINNVSTPVYILAVPLVRELIVEINDLEGQPPAYTHTIKPIEWLKDAFADSDVVSIKLSPYPPFKKVALGGPTFNVEMPTAYHPTPLTWKLRITVPSTNFVQNAREGVHNIWFDTLNISTANSLLILDETYMPIIYRADLMKYEYLGFSESNIAQNLLENDLNIRTLRDVRFEPKLKVAPFKKYSLFYRSDEGFELHPEICMNEGPLNGNVTIHSYATPDMSDLVVSTYVSFSSQAGEINSSQYYTELNTGLNSKFNYMYPSGTNALSNFYQTQQATVAQESITKVIAGIIGIGAGVALSSTGNPLGPVSIATGVASIGAGVGKGIAKVTDATNTPNKVGATSSNLYHDYNIFMSNGLSYLPIYVVETISDVEQKMILDYFYNYGYNVQRECHFTEVFIHQDYNDALITRRIFNYIKINDNLRKHFNSKEYSVPQIVVEKINEIFNNGITLWTLIDVPLSWESVDRYLFRNIYENVEINL